MAGGTIIARARRSSGLSQRTLARLSGTAQPTLSVYERGEKSPTLAVAERIVEASGYDLDLTPRVSFAQHACTRGEP
ncbi:helix-turn-helix domain-containing protein [Nocardioides sp.]|uniref:helix-turn-helix domain-containing protein n=1 Tax=Nocardioides sp. TaxID=35761 RepID=UPI0039E397A7